MPGSTYFSLGEKEALARILADETVKEDDDERPEVILSRFYFHDEHGDVVAFDIDEESELENNLIFATGSLLPNQSEAEAYGFLPNSSGDCNLKVRNLGPVKLWWTAEGGKLGISTENAHYFLKDPLQSYVSFMDRPLEKIQTSEAVMKCFLDAFESKVSDLTFHRLSSLLEPRISDNLLTYGKFIINQVVDFCSSDMDLFGDILKFSCIKRLKEGTAVCTPQDELSVYEPNELSVSELAELSVSELKIGPSPAVKSVKRVPVATRQDVSSMKCATSHEVAFSKATTTILVREVFEECFSEQIAFDDQKTSAEDNDHETSTTETAKLDAESKVNNDVIVEKLGKGRNGKACSWVGNSTLELNGKSFYEKVELHGLEVTLALGDFVRTSSKKICKVSTMFVMDGGSFLHVQEFVPGRLTILGATADPYEIFETNVCYNVNLNSIADKLQVCFSPMPENWRLLGGTEESLRGPPIEKSDKTFFYKMRYDHSSARFEMSEHCKFDIKEASRCISCEFKQRWNLDRKMTPIESLNPGVHCLSMKKWKGFIFEDGVKHMVGDAVFLSPKQTSGGGGINSALFAVEANEKADYSDETKYPEHYRKTDYVKGCNDSTPQPFDLGIITEVFNPVGSFSSQNLRLKIRTLYRPNQISCLKPKEAFAKDFNLVYWSNDIRTVEANAVKGKCFVLSKTLIPSNISVEEWTLEGQHRFYFEESYSKTNEKVTELNEAALDYKVEGDMGKLPRLAKPLRALDVFAGCGGLSSGLKEVGVSEANWAIEVYEPAAEAYKMNEPHCTVFTDDCNALLRMVMEDHQTEHQGQKLPQKGEVDLLCGGPPCQGFSGMNRFNSGEYSQFKNSLISTYLSYCDYYRPRFFILENVRNFASFKSSMILKLCLRALTKMGYQCSFAILQAGHYGVAQTRRRCIILAAAPGEKLPLFPEPQHVFSKVALSVTIDDVRFQSNCKWVDSGAPYRTVTVMDTMSDLPEIPNGWSDDVMDYGKQPESPFQRQMRRMTLGEENSLFYHVCKEMNQLNAARMRLIPKTPGSDWRDLPNIRCKLADGSYTDLLVYNYHDVEKGRGRNGKLRGVCNCATFKDKKNKCRDSDKQVNTLIPWCLPHTSNRHNNWAGLYGRIAWDGFFSTTVTNPEPMGKQGRVLHPEQHRLVSVRECARSQGFPDHYKFYGTILQKHRQVGNAVAPPMGKALGLEILKVIESEV